MIIIKLPYENPKWEKERNSLLDARRKYFKNTAPLDTNTINLDGYIRDFNEKTAAEKDYASFFYKISVRLSLMARNFYLFDSLNPIYLDCMYQSGLAGIIANGLGGVPLNQWKNDLQLVTYELVALEETDFSFFKNENSVINCLLCGNLEAASNLLQPIEMDIAVLNGSRYIEMKYLKNLYLAIVEQDEVAFNNELILRVQRFRRNSYDHSVVIDTPGAAMIKLAKQYGIHCNLNFAEYPDALLNQPYIVDPIKFKLPFYDEVIKILDKKGIQL